MSGVVYASDASLVLFMPRTPRTSASHASHASLACILYTFVARLKHVPCKLKCVNMLSFLSKLAFEFFFAFGFTGIYCDHETTKLLEYTAHSFVFFHTR